MRGLVRIGLGLVAISAVAAGGAAAAPAPGVTQLVSVSSAGVQGNQDSELPSVSADGRFVAFVSLADNLVPGDTNVAADVFVHDRRTGTTERVSVSSAGVQGDADSGFLNGMGGPSLSFDGRYVVFDSEAGNLVLGDTNGSSDVFVHDRRTGTTERISVGVRGGGGFAGSISDLGNRVAYISFADDIVEPDTNFASDVFVHDRISGETVRVSDAPDGSQANNTSFDPHLSLNGRFVQFDSFASNLVAGDEDSLDVFVHDLTTGRTEGITVVPGATPFVNVRGGDGDISADGRFVVFSTQDSAFFADQTPSQDVVLYDRLLRKYEVMSVSTKGVQGNDTSQDGAVTAGGRYVVFSSFAMNLVPEDRNFRFDVFVRDRLRDTTKRVSVGGRRDRESDLDSGSGAVDAFGGVIAFASRASTFVQESQDFFATDIFVRVD